MATKDFGIVKITDRNDILYRYDGKGAAYWYDDYSPHGGTGSHGDGFDHIRDILIEMPAEERDRSDMAVITTANCVPGESGENTRVVLKETASLIDIYQNSPLTANWAAGEFAGEDSASPLPTYKISTIANYIKNGYWSRDGQYSRSFNIPHGNNVINADTIYYNYSGFSSISGAGSDPNGLTADRRVLVDKALDYLGEILGIRFLYSDRPELAHILYKDNISDKAFSNSKLLESGISESSHRYINYSWVNVPTDWDGGTSDPDDYDYTYQTIIHETLHALGLGHPGPYNNTAAFITDTTQATTNNNIYLNDSWQQSIMSYFNQDVNTTINADHNYVITIMAADFEVLRSYYGSSAFTGDTIYGFNTNISSSLSEVMSNLRFYADKNAFCIIDDGGTDTVDFSGYSADQKIDLAIASGASTVGSISDIGGTKGNMTLGIGTLIENAVGGSGSDTITGNIAYNNLAGGSGNDTLYGYGGNDTLNGGPGSDSMYGGDGDDIYYIDSSGDTITEDAGAGTDTVNADLDYTLVDHVENLSLSGMATTGTGNILHNTITGNSNNNTLKGLDGNDTLNGGPGNDSMYGGPGDDTYYVDSSGDKITEDAAAGTDTVYSTVSYRLNSTNAANVENLHLQGAATVATGNALSNGIVGNSNDNTLYGLSGNDTLDGGLGNDSMYGGAGNDIYFVDSDNDKIYEDPGAGTDRIYAYLSYKLDDNIERLYLDGTAAAGTGNTLDNYIIGNGNANDLSGLGGNDILYSYEGADTLNGNEGDDYLYGGDGNDILDGGPGDDHLYGGAGNDIYYVDSASDYIKEAATSGTDKVYASVSFTLDSNIENIYLQNFNTAINGYGNALDNRMYGNNSANYLYGLEGNDYLYGYSGNDILIGGAGSDYMAGGVGDDYYSVDGTADVVYEAADSGTDTVAADVSYSLNSTKAANIENLHLQGTATAATGNARNNVIVGNGHDNALFGLGGNDTMSGETGNDAMEGGDGNDLLYGNDGNDGLNGGSGNDYLFGGAGDDHYYVDSSADVVFEDAGEGTDTVDAEINYTLNDHFENLFLFGIATTGVGNALNNVLAGNSSGQASILIGLEGNDSMNGNSGNDYLDGGPGNDYLDGGIGNDTLTGGAGNDVYYVDNVKDSVIEALLGGTDRVNAYVSDTLDANVENLYLYGLAVTGTGNKLKNTIVGNRNANTLDGLGGDDTLNGGSGKDILKGGTGNDILIGGAGSDIFVFAETGEPNRDTIKDFSPADDTIILRDMLDGLTDSAIKGLYFTGNVLNPASYFEGTGYTGNGKEAKGIYNNTSTGEIWYNPTTKIVGDSVLLCTVGTPTASTLDNTDFAYAG